MPNPGTLSKQTAKSATQSDQIMRIGQRMKNLGLNALPEAPLKQYVPSYLTFEDAIKLKDLKQFDLSEKQIMQRFSKAEPEKVLDYIFRDLDEARISDQTRLRNLDEFLLNNQRNGLLRMRGVISKLIENGKLDLVTIIMNKHKSLNRIRFKPQEISEAARRGHKRTVLWILERAERFDDLTMDAIVGSVDGQQFQIFKIFIDKRIHSDQAIQYALSQNLLSFVNYGFQKMRTTKTMTHDWFLNLVGNYVLSHNLDGRPHPELLEFLFSQPEWNPRYVDNLLNLMIFSKNDVSERIGLEFLNPRFIFKVKAQTGKIMLVSGPDALDAAISACKSQSCSQHVMDVLLEIRKKI